MKLIFEKHRNGIQKNITPLSVVNTSDLDRSLPQCFDRKELNLPEVSESEVIRHYMALSKKNTGVDQTFYPLGSCTMKYNPRINEETSRLEGFCNSHPFSDPSLVQGNLELLFKLSVMLEAITGLDAVSLQPAAGAHGELTGLMIMKAWFKDQKQNRTKIITPDSSHGTNPATARMCGFSVIPLKSNKEGMIDPQALKSIMTDDVAGIMITNPNTLGIFEKDIEAITQIVHSKGGLVYGDGANANALLGKTLFSKMGFDIVHLNLHKTFSTPHGGGGPGAGPVAVTKALAPYLPAPVPVFKNSAYGLKIPEKTIGRVRSFNGNFSVLVRAYTYILQMGSDGLSKACEHAVLNSHYLREKLKDHFNLAYKTPSKHEFVLDDTTLPDNISTLDIAKRLLDYGFHPPTVYFPLIVAGAMMIEPTETETKETLDAFADALIKIKKEAEENPETVKNAPHTLCVNRLDEVRAARKPDLRYRPAGQATGPDKPA